MEMQKAAMTREQKGEQWAGVSHSSYFILLFCLVVHFLQTRKPMKKLGPCLFPAPLYVWNTCGNAKACNIFIFFFTNFFHIDSIFFIIIIEKEKQRHVLLALNAIKKNIVALLHLKLNQIENLWSRQPNACCCFVMFFCLFTTTTSFIEPSF